MADTQPLVPAGGDRNVNSEVIIGYKSRQCGCLWIPMLIGGIYKS